MHDVISPVLLIALAGVLLWSTVRALAMKNSLMKWAGASLAALLAAGVLVAGALTIAGLIRMQPGSAAIPELKVAATVEGIQRGEAIANSFCAGCRSGPLTGGLDIGEHFPIPLGSFTAANLTPAGRLSRWSDGEIFRAIRNNIDADGHWMFVMSYTNAGKLSDDDIAALIAYLRSRPAAGRQTADPPDRLNLLGLVMLGAGTLPGPRSVSTDIIRAPPKGPTAQYGEYILSYQDCRACHGADLNGGVQGQLAPVGPGLGIVQDWTVEQFISTLRTGINPGGHELANEMPWQPMAKMDDDELAAIYKYLIHMSSQGSATP